VAETANIAEIASKISKEIFKVFKWEMCPRRDENFSCVTDLHLKKGQVAKTHPADVVFSYQDPYLTRQIYLHTDLKSYGKSSITQTSVRTALRSLAETIECAAHSPEWRAKYCVEESHEVRGLLFVHNHDNKYKSLFSELMSKIDTTSLPIAQKNIIHILGPTDIGRIYSIAHDIGAMKAELEIFNDYTFYYPDLILRHRHGDIWNRAATIESLTGPFFIVKHNGAGSNLPGFIVYYNREGATVEEFEYLIDCMSRFQLLESGQSVHVRCVFSDASSILKSNFATAVNRYAKAWGFEAERQKVLEAIEIDRINTFISNYNHGDIGWRA